MADQVILESPFGMLALTPDQVREASARANEVLLAVGSAPDPALTPSIPGEQAQWLSVDEVAQLSGLKKSWIYEQVRSDNIPHRHFGKQVRIPTSYLAEPDPKSGANGQGGQ